MEYFNPDNYLPLSETTLYILLSLAPGPKHGYAIAKEVQALSNNKVIISVSTLYTTLKRLLEDQFIERVGEDPDPGDPSRPRKIYALTDRGQQILAAEKMRLRSLIALFQTRNAENEG